MALPPSTRHLSLFDRNWPRRLLPPARLLAPVLILALLYLSWPYATLWRLNQALIAGDTSALAALIELPAIREEIQHRLNKEHHSVIPEVSDDFILWLEQGIQRSGREALDELVTQEWVCEQLRARSVDAHGFLPAVTHAWFEGPVQFAVELKPASTHTLWLRLRFMGVGWRLVTLYY